MLKRFRLWPATLLLGVAAGGCHPGLRDQTHVRTDGVMRAIWVTRWDYKTPADIRRVLDNCRSGGFNTVLFQVRGNGTALYRSKIEPWADEMGGRDPGFDPLAVACREAHRRGLKLHAWVNVIPGWFGDKPPANPRQLYHARAGWFWRDSRGRRQPLGWYSSLNPCYPEVRRYLVAVMREIVKGYPIDGLHMDYIRFPNDYHKCYLPARRVPDYPRDGKTLALFKRATGRAPDSAPHLWDKWRTAQITQLVRDIRRMCRSVRPRAWLSAAVGATPDEARRAHFQDSRRWLSEGLLDAVFPMNYASDQATFDRRVAAWAAINPRVPVVMGIMADKRDSTTVVRQIDRARGRGGHFALFAYNSLFERTDRSGRLVADRQSAARATLRRGVIPHMRRVSRAGM